MGRLFTKLVVDRIQYSSQVLSTASMNIVKMMQIHRCQNCQTLLTSLSRQRRRISQIRSISISNTKPGHGESSRAAAWAAEICCNVHLHSVFSQHAADKTLGGGGKVTGDFADCNNYHFHRITPQTSVCLECVSSAVSSPPDNHLYSPHTLVFPLSLKFNNSVKCIMSGCLSPRVQVRRCGLRAVG